MTFPTMQTVPASAADETSVAVPTGESPPGQSLQDLFVAQAQKTPAAIALIYGADSLSYGELNQRTNQCANYLIRLGLGPEMIVGLCMERSIEMVVGLLGIVKAGAAYLPLDPGYPVERLAFMVADSGTAAVMIQSCLRQRFSAQGNNLICIDTEWKAVSDESAEEPAALVTPDNLVYVIYTSGSTGAPKGVMVTHRGLVNYLSWSISQYFAKDSNGSLVHSPLAFDLTVTSLLAPLVCGQSVTLLPARSGLAELSAALRNGSHYGLLKITPSHLDGLGYMLAPEDVVGRVGALIIGGEALRAESLCFWRKADPSLRIINEYGPTETVVGCATYEVSRTDPSTGPVSIGRPIANTSMYVLDRHLQPVPVGITGELYSDGPGLARGYLNHPDLSAEKFLPNPFASEPGQRLYATGDLARCRPDGNLDFIGRADGQVKIRGHRVELEEVEAALRKLPEIQNCVVMAREDEPGEKRLVAYIVAKDNWQSVTDLRAKLKETLPDYLVPSAFVFLQSLPLTANGKIDRHSLPAPDQRPELKVIQVDARDSMELQLVDIWEQILSVRHIGVNDDFFDLGGNSILAARLFAQIESRFGKRVPLATLFQVSTIADLARVLRRDWSPAWSSLVALRPEGSRPPLYCVHACGPHVLLYRSLVRHLSPDQPVYGLEAQGSDGQQKPLTRVEDMAARYVKEIRDFQPSGPYYLLGDTLGGLFALEMAHQFTIQRQEVAFLAMFDTICPLPQSPGRRVLCHLSHLKQLGAKTYLLAGARSVKKRLVRGTISDHEDLPLTAEEQAYENSVSAADDPLARLEWAIYRATQVNYVPPKRIAAKITYFLARDNEYGTRFEDNRLRWRTVARGGFEVYVTPGRHNTISQEPHVAVLAEKLTACLERAQATRGLGIATDSASKT